VMTSSKERFLSLLVVLLSSLSFLAVRGGVTSSELFVDATLVWGAKAAPADKKLQAVGKELQAKLRKSFKWEHYYEITDKSFRIADVKPHRVRMSDKCVVEVRRLGDQEVNVKLIGEGKVVVNRRQSLAKDDSVVLGGPCKDESAWFVVLRFK
jgi:hypothetical protein